MARRPRSWSHALLPLSFLVIGALAQSSCDCIGAPAAALSTAILPCAARGESCPAAPPLDATAKTTTPGTITGGFSVTSAGDGAYIMPLTPVPGRNHVEPELSLVYNSSAGEGALGVGFSLTGTSAISRCPKSLLLDDEIRGVRFDAEDKLCLDGRRLVPVADAPGRKEYRTVPDTFIKVVGHFPADAAEKTPNNALSFEARLPSGLVRFDAWDKLCLDGRRLVPVSEEPSFINFATLPDTSERRGWNTRRSSRRAWST